jgi:nucleoside-diphosphate-sugar epimerase
MPGPVLVTGASGFIGRALADRFRARGDEVRGVDLRPDRERGVSAGEVTLPGAWQDRAAGCDTVVHAAAIVSMRRGSHAFWRANVLATRHALDAAVRGGARRFVHLSSITVFGFDFPDGVDERHPTRPSGVPYIDTKIASEQAVLQAHATGEIECTVVRPGDVYGPGSRPWAVLPVEALKARRLVLPAMGRGIFSQVYVDDLVEGIALAAERPEAAGQVFTLTDGAPVETREFFGHYARLLGRRRVPALPTSAAVALAGLAGALDRGGEVNAAAARYLARRGSYSIARARSVLGYRPAVSLDEGMERTAAWLRSERIVD